MGSRSRQKTPVKVLLDTHILLWWFGDPKRLSRRQRAVVESAGRDSPLMVSEISLWEIATLVQSGRVSLDLPLREWLERATAPPLVRRLGVSPAVAAAAAALPASFPGDPADRIIVATARVEGATVLTQDERIRRARVVPTLG
ncbi:MAG: twitching motility protein PilT [Candidatus Binatia bacterium]|nr:MAG: twitching motility protein PilT [Candidatus Binatia bacterium]